MIDSFSTCSGERMAENPRINKMLNRLEPIAFPSARPLSPFLVATMEVTSSGREVPLCQERMRQEGLEDEEALQGYF